MDPEIKDSLQSKHFTSDVDSATASRLLAALRSDGSNIRPFSRGAHVSAIQRALNDIKDSSLNPGIPRDKNEDTDGQYDAGTQKAVRAYKSIKGIQRTGQPLDEVTGRMTMTSLDNLLIQIEAGNKPAPPPQPQPQPTPSGWNFVTPAKMPIIVKFLADDPSKSDLADKETNKEVTQLAIRRLRPGAFPFVNLDPPHVSTCERALVKEIRQGGDEAKRMADPLLFTSTVTGNVHIFPIGHFFSDEVLKDKTFIKSNTGLTADIIKTLKENTDIANKRTDLNQLASGQQPPHLEGFAIDIDWSVFRDPTLFIIGYPLAFAFGSIQSIKVSITTFNGSPDGKYSGTLKYEIGDHFGADDNDISSFVKRTDGQAALYLLQRGLAGEQDKSRYKPYRSIIIVESTFSDDASIA